jgi:PPM family protein phosphatase
MAHPEGLEFAARTDTGRVRAQNEDAVATSPAYGFVVLADGMGGYSAGEIASGIALQVTCRYLEDGLRNLKEEHPDTAVHTSQALQHVVVDAFQRANTAILEAAHAEPRYSGMGTTLVAAVFQSGSVTVAHVGDSRAYRLRDAVLTQITRDHSLLQEQIDAGLISPEWAPYAQHRNLVTRAVGIAAEMEVEIHDHAVEGGDLYLLCSDGLSDMLLDDELTALLLRPAASLDALCERLVEAANANGGQDNISVALIRVAPAAGQRGFFGRILEWTR